MKSWMALPSMSYLLSALEREEMREGESSTKSLLDVIINMSLIKYHHKSYSKRILIK